MVKQASVHNNGSGGGFSPPLSFFEKFSNDIRLYVAFFYAIISFTIFPLRSEK